MVVLLAAPTGGAGLAAGGFALLVDGEGLDRVRALLSREMEAVMVILGIVLIVLGLLVAGLHLLLTIGVILLVVGLILNLVPIGGTRRRYY
jgi:hypothetical protein